MSRGPSPVPLPGHGALPTLLAGAVAALAMQVPREVPLVGLASLVFGFAFSWVAVVVVPRIPSRHLVAVAGSSSLAAVLLAALAGGSVVASLIAAALAVTASRLLFGGLLGANAPSEHPQRVQRVRAPLRCARTGRFGHGDRARTFGLVRAASATLGISVFAVSAAVVVNVRVERPVSGLARLAGIVVDALDPRSAPAPLDDPTPPPERRPRRLLVVTVDTLAWDSLSRHGGPEPTPTLDRLAASGLDFDRALTPSTDPVLAIAALAAGREADRLADLAQARTLFDDLHLADRRSAFVATGPSLLGASSSRDRSLGAGSFESPRSVREIEAALAELPVSLDLVWVHLGDPLEVRAVDAAVAQVIDSPVARGADLVFSSLRGERDGPRLVREPQIRVPLFVVAEGVAPARHTAPISSATVLREMAKRTRTGDSELSLPLVDVFVSSPRAVLLARRDQRIRCERKGSCVWFDLAADPTGRRPNVGGGAALDELTAALGERRVELARRGDTDAVDVAFLRLELGANGAVEQIARLLAEGEASARRRVARRLFDLADRRFLPALRSELPQTSDPAVKALIALALTRLGDGAPIAIDLLEDEDETLRDLAALALLENGVDRGFERLVRRLRAALSNDGKLDESVLTRDLARAIALALGKTQREEIVGLLVDALEVPALTEAAARGLASAGHDAGRPALARALTRIDRRTLDAVAESLLALGGGPELAQPLT
jgi:hypothetical protein